MKRFLLVLPLIAILASACQKQDAPLAQSYEGQYSLQVTTQFTYDGTPVASTGKGTLLVIKNADGTYTFTENLNVIKRSYQVKLTGKSFELPIQPEFIPVNGVDYYPQSGGSGEFKTTGSITNSVTITRTTAFEAGSVRVKGTITSFGYH